MQQPFSLEAAGDQATKAEPLSDQKAPPPAPPPRRQLRLGSLNIRYDFHSRHPLQAAVLQPALSLIQGRTWGEHRWQERRDALVDQVLFHDLDLVGFQEVLHHQLEDLVHLMDPSEYGHAGVGRDDGKHAGEAVPIFYRRRRLELLHVTHRWLSPTPDRPGSKGWDAGQPRMITLAHFRDRARPAHSESDGRADLIVGNTHWDDRGVQAREESAKLILRLVAEEQARTAIGKAGVLSEQGQGLAAPAVPEPLVVLLGDLNSPAEESGYQVLTGHRYPDGQAAGPPPSAAANTEDARSTRSFYDSRHELVRRGAPGAPPGAMSRRFGPLNTYTGFEPSDIPKVIDFVLPLGNGAFLPSSSRPPPPDSASDPEPGLGAEAAQPKWRVQRYGVVPNFFEDVGGRRGGPDSGSRQEGACDAMILSDHRLVVAAFQEVEGR